MVRIYFGPSFSGLYKNKKQKKKKIENKTLETCMQLFPFLKVGR